MKFAIRTFVIFLVLFALFVFPSVPTYRYRDKSGVELDEPIKYSRGIPYEYQYFGDTGVVRLPVLIFDLYLVLMTSLLLSRRIGIWSQRRLPETSS